MDISVACLSLWCTVLASFRSRAVLMSITIESPTSYRNALFRYSRFHPASLGVETGSCFPATDS
jgi:hypothetical protein